MEQHPVIVVDQSTHRTIHEKGDGSADYVLVCSNTQVAKK